MCLRIASPAISRVGNGGLARTVPCRPLRTAPPGRRQSIARASFTDAVHVDDLIKPRSE